MLTEKDFQERYKSYSNVELFDIIDNPKGYQLIALNVAKAELLSRNLNESEIAEAKHILRQRKEKLDKQAAHNEKLKNKISSIGSEVVETISPIQTSIPTVSKIIFLLNFIFTLILLLQIWNDWYSFKYIVIGESGEKFAYSINLFPVILLLIGIIFSWRKKKPGWTILVVYCAYSLIQFLFGSYFSFSYHFGPEKEFRFFQPPSPTSYILIILIWLGMILTLIRKDIREVYQIKRKDEIAGPIVAGILIGIVLIMLRS